METFRKLFTGITISYPSMIFIGDNNKQQLTMLNKVYHEVTQGSRRLDSVVLR
jgi:hypothetical protein